MVQIRVLNENFEPIIVYIVIIATFFFLVTAIPPLIFDRFCYKYNIPSQQSLIQEAEKTLLGLLHTKQAKQQKHEFFFLFFLFFLFLLFFLFFFLKFRYRWIV